MPKKSHEFTAENYQFKNAPSLIRLLGDRAKPESAQHIIEFPGGAVEVSRTTDGNYWAHIIINRGHTCKDFPGLGHCRAVVLDSRLQIDGEVLDLPQDKSISQIAVLIGRAE